MYLDKTFEMWTKTFDFINPTVLETTILTRIFSKSMQIWVKEELDSQISMIRLEINFKL